ncbi:MAG: hypothetical protein Q8L41_08020 [Anaerolineales bacterium]|nr:hypothetical protein [Anaerolineales bacterium]
MFSQDLIQSAYTKILETFINTGRAPHYSEMASMFGLIPDRARELQRETVAASPVGGCWMSHDTDYIESWAPFSNVPTHNLISVDGVQKWYGQ